MVLKSRSARHRWRMMASASRCNVPSAPADSGADAQWRRHRAQTARQVVAHYESHGIFARGDHHIIAVVQTFLGKGLRAVGFQVRLDALGELVRGLAYR